MSFFLSVCVVSSGGVAGGGMGGSSIAGLLGAGVDEEAALG